ncbi:ABC transporter permease [Amycolatopsis anabasis]|uniref:ABC transporter permease n=1 Tax=Amycolatopsis anabasis TaxID=1840409 RepID=UPI00131B9435|nr:ABC transporter permease subunit [Amycolatopsis anabasis]
MGEFFDELGRYLGSANNRAEILGDLGEHVYLALLPLVLGIVLAIAAGWLGCRWQPARNVLLVVSNLLYTIPSLALFVVIPGIIGSKILDSVNVIVALTIYTTALLVRPVLDALDAVPPHVIAAATAVGYRPARRFFGVELPLSVPVLAAGVRVASVSNISLVSVGALIGTGGLGVLFTDGFQREYFSPIVVGIVLTLLLALVVDLLLVLLRNVATPWERASRAKPATAAREVTA